MCYREKLISVSNKHQILFQISYDPIFEFIGQPIDIFQYNFAHTLQYSPSILQDISICLVR